MKYAELVEAAKKAITEERTELATDVLVERLKEINHLEKALAEAKAQLTMLLGNDIEDDDTEL